MLGFKAKTPAVLRPPVPITAPTAFQRALGGSVMMLPQLAWGIGANGTLTAIAAVTGSDYSSVYCAQPEWYQGVTWAVNMTVAPDCRAAVTTPNSDVQSGTFALPSGAWQSVVFIRSGFAYRYWCGPTTAVLAAGQAYRFTLAGGATTLTTSRTTNGLTECGRAAGTQQYWRQSQNTLAEGYPLDAVKIERIVQASGAVLETASKSSGDPVRTPKCKITWSDSTVTTGTGIPYKETTGLPLSAAGLGCESAFVSKPGAGPDFLPSRIQVESDDGGSITTISDQEVPPMTETQRLPMTTGNGRGLVLEKTVGTILQSCMTWEADCANWWEETDEGTTPGTYKCSFGGVTIDLAECGPYRRTFDTKTDKPTITDPVTGEDTEWSAGPDVNSTNPGTGPTPGDACMAQWASAPNPLEWVLQPVKCALVWAFVPRASVVTATQVSIASAWSTTMPGKLPGIVSAALVVPGDPGGCMGPHVFMPFSSINSSWPNFDAYPLQACSSPMAEVAAAARTIGAAILIYLTAMGIIRRASASVNAPGVGGGPS
ncbi:hypothetical protein [Microbacterium sp. Root61]|uniref:hypothetical protein n=1 Tax=Microbacterium sp. Root61 TaxID=1736570 RepID=UPI001F456ED3|nr:hypothetical protein [Microbacterium sp. Root61]